MRLVLLLSLFTSSLACAGTCGLKGSVEERIQECGKTKGDFAQVAVSEKGAEFYQDTKSKLIWGNRIAADFNQYGSQKACSHDVSEYQILDALKWRLPSIQELEEAAAHGMKTALPNMEYSYWSSTPVLSKKTRRKRARAIGVYLWDGFEERTGTGDNLKDAASVRCVARE
jgi:hypothetical protein